MKIALLEAGLRYRSREAEGGFELAILRGQSPAQGSVPGLHHIIADGNRLWTCERASRVARMDATSGAIAAVASIARRASHLALDPAGKLLFVADAEADEIVALDAATLAERQRWAAPGAPQIPLVSPDGIVCVTGSGSGTVTLARPRAGRFVAETIEIGACPHDPLLARDGQHLFVPCMGSAELVKLRLADCRIIGRIAVPEGPAHLAAHPTQDRIYVASSWAGSVTSLSGEGELQATAPSGGWAHAIAVAPDDCSVWVSNFLEDTLAVFDADRLDRVALLETEPYPHGLDIVPDAASVVVTGFAGDHLRIFATESRRLVGRVAIGRGGSHSAFAAGRAFTACAVEDHIAAIDLAAPSLIDRIRLQPLSR